MKLRKVRSYPSASAQGRIGQTFPGPLSCILYKSTTSLSREHHCCIATQMSLAHHPNSMTENVDHYGGRGFLYGLLVMLLEDPPCLASAVQSQEFWESYALYYYCL